MNARTKKRVGVLIILAGIAAGSVFGAYQFRKYRASVRLQNSYASGMAAYEKGDWDATMKDLGYYVSQSTNDAAAVLAVADARRRIPEENSRHITTAIQFARRASEIDPKAVAPLELLLDLYQQAGYITERLDVADRLLAIDPKNRAAIDARIFCLAVASRFDDALATARAAAAVYDDDVQAHRSVVELLSLLQRSPQEIRAYADEVAQRHGDALRFKIFRAEVYGGSGDVAGAARLAREAQNAPIGNAEELASILRLFDLLSVTDPELGRIAQRILETQLQGPLAAQVAPVAAERAWKQGLVDVARDRILSVLDLSNLEKADDATIGWAGLLAASETGTPDPRLNAAVFLEQLTKRRSPESEFWAAIIAGAQSLQSGDLAAAAEHLRVAQGRGIRVDIASFHQGRLDERIGEWQRAVTRYETLLRQEPNWRAVHIQLIALLMRNNQFDQAVNRSETAFAINSQIAEAHLLGRSLTLLIESGRADPGRTQRAVSLANELETQAPNDAMSQLIAARIYNATKAPTNLARVVDRLVSMNPLPAAESLAELASQVRVASPQIADRLLAAAESTSAENPVVLFNMAQRRVDDGRPDDARTLMNQALERSQGENKERLELFRAYLFDRINDPQAAVVFAEIAAQREKNPEVQLALLEARAPWSDENIVGAAIKRLRAVTGEDATAWRVYEARRLLVFSPSEARAAQAVQYLTDVLRRDASSVPAMILAAEARVLLKDRAGAIDLLAKAADAAPDVPGTYPRLIELLQEAGRADEARRRLISFNRITNLNPEQQRRRARLFAAQGMWDEALADFQSLADSGGREDTFQLALTQIRRGDLVDAKKNFDKLTESGEIEVGLAVAAANFYASQGDLTRGRALFERLASTTAPAQRQALLAAYLERSGQVDEAQRLYESLAVDSNPDSIADLARFHFEQGRPDVAGQLVARGLAANPGNNRLQELGGFIKLSAGGNVSEAFADISAALAARDSSPLIRKLFSAIQAFQSNSNDVAPFAKSMEDLLKEDPRFFPASRLLVAARLQQGEPVKALDSARAASRAAPTDPRPAKLVAEVLAATGQPQDALIAARQWRDRMVGDTFEPDIAIARLLLELNRNPEALALLLNWKDRIVSEADKAPDQLELLATAMVNGGRIADAATLIGDRPTTSDAWAMAAARIGMSLTGSGGAIDQWLAPYRAKLESFPEGRLLLAQIAFQRAAAGETAQFNIVDSLLQPLLEDSQLRAPAAMMLAAASQEAGNNARAIDFYRRALADRPEDIAVLNNLAYLLAYDRATAPEAVQLALKANRNAQSARLPASQQKVFLDTLGVAQLNADQPQQAEDSFRKGLALDPTDRNLQAGLAEAALAQGRTAEAQATLRLFEGRPRTENVPTSVQRRFDRLREKLPK